MISDLQLRVALLEREVHALRSVLSELDADKSCHSQMHKADAIQELLYHINWNDSTFERQPKCSK